MINFAEIGSGAISVLKLVIPGFQFVSDWIASFFAKHRDSDFSRSALYPAIIAATLCAATSYFAFFRNNSAKYPIIWAVNDPGDFTLHVLYYLAGAIALAVLLFWFGHRIVLSLWMRIPTWPMRDLEMPSASKEVRQALGRIEAAFGRAFDEQKKLAERYEEQRAKITSHAESKRKNVDQFRQYNIAARMALARALSVPLTRVLHAIDRVVKRVSRRPNGDGLSLLRLATALQAWTTPSAATVAAINDKANRTMAHINDNEKNNLEQIHIYYLNEQKSRGIPKDIDLALSPLSKQGSLMHVMKSFRSRLVELGRPIGDGVDASSGARETPSGDEVGAMLKRVLTQVLGGIDEAYVDRLRAAQPLSQQARAIATKVADDIDRLLKGRAFSKDEAKSSLAIVEEAKALNRDVEMAEPQGAAYETSETHETNKKDEPPPWIARYQAAQYPETSYNSLARNLEWTTLGRGKYFRRLDKYDWFEGTEGNGTSQKLDVRSSATERVSSSSPEQDRRRTAGGQDLGLDPQTSVPALLDEESATAENKTRYTSIIVARSYVLGYCSIATVFLAFGIIIGGAIAAWQIPCDVACSADGIGLPRLLARLVVGSISLVPFGLLAVLVFYRAATANALYLAWAENQERATAYRERPGAAASIAVES